MVPLSLKIYLAGAILLQLTFKQAKAQTNDPWETYMTPASFHQLLSLYTGDFNMEILMAGLKEPIVVSSSNKMILGGRFLEMTQLGKMLGMDFEGITTIGFNTIDSTVSLVTITNMGTGTLALKGHWDEVKKIAVLSGTLVNPVNRNTINVRQVIKIVVDNEFIIESYDQEGDGMEKKMVSYRFTRK